MPLLWQYGLKVHSATLSSFVLHRIPLSRGAGYLEIVLGFDARSELMVLSMVPLTISCSFDSCCSAFLAGDSAFVQL